MKQPEENKASLSATGRSRPFVLTGNGGPETNTASEQPATGPTSPKREHERLTLLGPSGSQTIVASPSA